MKTRRSDRKAPQVIQIKSQSESESEHRLRSNKKFKNTQNHVVSQIMAKSANGSANKTNTNKKSNYNSYSKTKQIQFSKNNLSMAQQQKKNQKSKSRDEDMDKKKQDDQSHLINDFLSSSEVSSGNSYSSEDQESSAFMNLMPVNQNKKRKSLNALKSYLVEQQLTNTPNPTQQQNIKRAPILDLLRPRKQTNQRQDDSQSEISIQNLTPPESSVNQHNHNNVELNEQLAELNEISQPKKKPKLLEQLEQELNKPAEQYILTGKAKEIREQRKKENKKRDYLIQKKFKQYRVGKKKDTVSNQVFNAIEDFFG